ncbi:hypothetical protein SHL15_1228 [Streptomyces hygroscopicus subsp. limoneus]|nr:hypothetical protein SHL15_1228 [Streptomyces hygroscopicus subsp. limoneus]
MSPYSVSEPAGWSRRPTPGPRSRAALPGSPSAVCGTSTLRTGSRQTLSFEGGTGEDTRNRA